ncbi:hypothetical protein [Bordetella genomosp. 13]|uniref:hypothetical protein n=1 Tax=Bordetella genomosp. 13 TaxID=463040 RepID=UPI0011A39E9E|nr:hypothetical protein [Bordetella genomosp. 13]
MSLPNTLFLARRGDAIDHVGGQGGTVRDLFEFGGITDLDLSNLYAIVTGEEFDFDRHELAPLEADADGELFELPQDLVAALAQRDEADIQRIALEWSRTEELNCDAQDLVPLLLALAALARGAGGEDRVYFTQ